MNWIRMMINEPVLRVNKDGKVTVKLSEEYAGYLKHRSYNITIGLKKKPSLLYRLFHPRYKWVPNKGGIYEKDKE